MARSTSPVSAPVAAETSSDLLSAPFIGAVRASALARGQRRMDAESYLTDGYGIRLALEAKPAGWTRFGEVARVSAPPRIKQILVSPEYGVPYMNTTQAFDARPKPRKWLAMGKTTKAEERLVKEGTILVIASGSVGRSIIASRVHESVIISHDFMRVIPVDDDNKGWIYAFLRSPQAQAMMTGAQYASIIRHLEPHHLASLPIPLVSDEVAADFQQRVLRIIDCRNASLRLTEAAEAAFADAIGPVKGAEAEHGFPVRASCMALGRRRFEAAYHAPHAQSIIKHFTKHEPVGAITKRVWWMSRFKRIYSETGTPYMSADDVFTNNPHALKKIFSDKDMKIDDFRVKKGWIVMARSGQTYGLNGSAMIISEYHEDFFLSDDLIRIIPDETQARAGYLLTALTHPALGRPLVIREAYGTSIPHLDPADVAAVPVARLDTAIENHIADLAESAAAERAKAELMERKLAEDAGAVVAEFLMRPTLQLLSKDEVDAKIAEQRLKEINARPELVLRGSELQAQLKRWES